MSEQHPNITLMQRLDPSDLAVCTELFAPQFVLHYFNPELPDLEGDHVGIDGFRSFFEKLGSRSAGTFRIEPISVTALGDEMVVAHTKNRMTLQGRSLEIDAVTLWRIVDGRIAELWDIPAVHTARELPAQS